MKDKMYYEILSDEIEAWSKKTNGFSFWDKIWGKVGGTLQWQTISRFIEYKLSGSPIEKVDTYTIKFDDTNPNSILFYEGEKLIHMIACPPTLNGCDIIKLGDDRKCGYVYNFDGLVLLTNPKERKLYHRGELIAKTKR
jgi:hypothetical protein